MNDNRWFANGPTIRDDDDRIVGQTIGDDFDVIDANARLMAAAPLMRDLLLALREHAPDQVDAIMNRIDDYEPNDGVELAEWAAQGCHWGGKLKLRVQSAANALDVAGIKALGRWADGQPDGIVTQTAITEYLIGDFSGPDNEA